MCLQDLQIAARATLVKVVIPDQAGTIRLPDMSRALWVYALQAGAMIPIYSNNGTTQADELRGDTRWSQIGGSGGVQVRERYAMQFQRGLFVSSDGVTGAITVVYSEMDIDTYTASLGLAGG